MVSRRRQTKGDSIQALLRASSSVGTVIDAGVPRDTPNLRQLFSNFQHTLFEPVVNYCTAIHRVCASLNYKLEPVAS